ncbi:MAG: tributyrin esterase [Chloroflexota bacterium]|nr:MAG: tributyrin esterase [Chloroflexota bacterium]
MKAIDAKTIDLKSANGAIKSSLNGQPVTVENAGHLHGLAAGLKHGEIVIQGSAGDYVGVLNDGATITVTKDAGNYVADNMTKGTVIIQGSTGYGAGQYCYGGTVVVHGNAGDFTATMNKGATVIVCGNVGKEVGTYMLKGDLIVAGDAGENFANYLIRGSVFIRGKWASLGNNTRQEPLTVDDKARLQAYFDKFDISADPATFKKIVAASEKPFYN